MELGYDAPELKNCFENIKKVINLNISQIVPLQGINSDFEDRREKL